MLRAQAVLKVAEQTVAARQLVVDQVTALAESKLKSTLDVSFANVNLADAKLLLVQAHERAARPRRRISPRPWAAQRDRLRRSRKSRCPRRMPDRVADLIAAGAAEPARAEGPAAPGRAPPSASPKPSTPSTIPSIGVVGSAGFVPDRRTRPSRARYGAIGMNVSIPIFNGGLFKARQTQAEMKAKAAAENVTDLQNRIARDVRVAWLNATTAYDRMALTQQLLDQAKMALDLAQTRYDLGLGNMVELSTAQLNVTSARSPDANARYDYQSPARAARLPDGSAQITSPQPPVPALTDNALADGIQNDLRPAVQIQLLHDIPAVRLHRVQAQVQQRRDLFVAASLGQQLAAPAVRGRSIARSCPPPSVPASGGRNPPPASC